MTLLRTGWWTLWLAAVLGCAPVPVSEVPTRVAPLPTPALATGTVTAAPTVTPDPTALALADQATATAAVAALPTLSPASRVETSVSPAGNGQAELWRAPCIALPGVADRLGYDELRWIPTDGATQLIARQVIVCGGLGASGLRVVQFAPDGDSLYYTEAAQGAPDGLPCGWVGQLWRWSIAGGERQGLLPGATAPDGERVAGATANRLMVWRWSDGQVLMDLNPLPAEWQITAAGWSPRGDRLLIVANDSACIFGGESALLVIDAVDGATLSALRSTNPFYMTARFETPSEVTVFGIDNQASRFALGADDVLRLLP